MRLGSKRAQKTTARVRIPAEVRWLLHFWGLEQRGAIFKFFNNLSIGMVAANITP
jgi:hypothetical protein